MKIMVVAIIIATIIVVKYTEKKFNKNLFFNYKYCEWKDIFECTLKRGNLFEDKSNNINKINKLLWSTDTIFFSCKGSSSFIFCSIDFSACYIMHILCILESSTFPKAEISSRIQCSFMST